MKFVDTVQLATMTSDGYGDKTITVLTDCPAVFVQRTSMQHNQMADDITSDAAVYLDPKNVVVTAKLNDLEGLYVKANGRWYRVQHAAVGVRKLLDNTVENIYCQLEKEAGVPYATNVS